MLLAVRSAANRACVGYHHAPRRGAAVYFAKERFMGKGNNSQKNDKKNKKPKKESKKPNAKAAGK